MEKSLEDERDYSYNARTQELKITYPLLDSIRDLKENYNTINRLHRERFEQVKTSDEVDKKLGFARVQEGPTREGWLINMHPVRSPSLRLERSGEWKPVLSGCGMMRMYGDIAGVPWNTGHAMK